MDGVYNFSTNPAKWGVATPLKSELPACRQFYSGSFGIAQVHYYKHNIGDYRRDTAHLSLLEHGIYRQLLDWYYLLEGPLPEDIDTVARKVAARSSEEISAVQLVLSEFFKMKKGWHHKRCELIICEFHETKTKNQTNGKLGGRPKKTQSVISGLDVGTQTQSQNNLNHKPRTSNQEPVTSNQEPKKKIKPKSASPPSVFVLPDWIEIDAWTAYMEVRKKKKAAGTDYALSLIVGTLDQIRSAGHDPMLALKNSIKAGWTDVYEPKAAFGKKLSGGQRVYHSLENMNYEEGVSYDGSF